MASFTGNWGGGGFTSQLRQDLRAASDTTDLGHVLLVHCKVNLPSLKLF